MNDQPEQFDPIPARKRPAVSRSSRSLTLVVFGVLALPMLVAIWSLPGFLVQDGPLYLYNSHIMLESFRSDSPFRQYFAHEWTPLPYWGAYALLMALMPVLSPRAADQVLMTLTSVGFASALIWLRWRIAGWQGGAIVAPLAIVLSINVLWTYGLYSFLLGTFLYFVTLAYWWRVRGVMGPRQAAVLSALFITGYLCHLISFGFTAIGIILLAVATPGPGFGRRLKWTVLSLVPSVPLMIHYTRVMGAGGGVGVHWTGITNFLSPADWLTYIFMADVPTIHNNGMKIPGGGFTQVLFEVPPPSRWALVGVVLLLLRSVLRRSDEDRTFYQAHRGWIAVAAVLLLGGLLGPDDIGSAHGGFLRERAVLLGLATLIPILRVDLKPAVARTGSVVLVMAAYAQVWLFWDYGLKSDRLVGEFMKVKPHVGRGNRVAAVMLNSAWQYRTGPVVHVSNLLGLNTGNLVWNNYAPALYYFPIRYRSVEAKMRSLFIGNRMPYYDFVSPGQKEMALDAYRAMMERGHLEIDVLVMWSSTPDLDAINRQWFESQPLYENERVKVFRHLAH